jgi:hypothetical protein
MERAYDYTHRIIANGPFAVRKSKESVLQGLATDVREAYKIESELSGQVFSSEYATEGPKAFAEKRAPVWKNREADSGVTAWESAAASGARGSRPRRSAAASRGAKVPGAEPSGPP